MTKIKAIFASFLCACVVALTFGMAACGKDGTTPQVGDNGNWFIGETDTGIKAEGKQGVGVKAVTINTEGKLVITLTNDEVLTLGKVVGENGEAGKGVKSFEINGEGKLVVTYSDDTTETLDKVVGNDGRSITDAHIDNDGNLVLEFSEGDDVTAGSVKGVGIESIEIVEGKFKITMTDGTVKELDIPTNEHVHHYTMQIGKLDPTCTSVGYIKYQCDVEGCYAQDIIIQKEKGHSFNEIPDFNSATCTEQGLAFYICSACGTTKSEIATAKGHKYGPDGNCIYCRAEKPSIMFSVNTGETTEVDIPSGITTGVNIVAVDLGEKKLSTGRLQMNVSGRNEVKSELVFSESRSEAQHNVYFSYINIAEGDTKITVSAVGENISNAKLTLDTYEMPTLEADGTPIEVPVNLNSVSTIDAADFKFGVDLSSVVAGSYNWTLTTTVASDVQNNLKLWFGGTTGITFSKSKFNDGGGNTAEIRKEDHLNGCEGYAFFQISSSGDTKNFIYPVTITLTATGS